MHIPENIIVTAMFWDSHRCLIRLCAFRSWGSRGCTLLYPLMSMYRVSPIIRPTRKIRPSVIFEDDFNVSPTLKISPS